ncbi:DUF1571 domain-containing protein [Desulfatiferula olefinivorans]
MKKATPVNRFAMLLLAASLWLNVSPADATSHDASPAFDPMELAETCKTAYENINDYTAVFLKQERFGNKLSEVETIEFKFRKPNDVYMRWIEKPNKGQEALFRKGHNEDRVKAHKGGLLNVINVNSAPEGKLVMDGQHHRIVDAGIGPTSALVFRGMSRGIERGEVTFKDHGIVEDKGRELLKIEAFYPETCDGITHIVANDETLWDIADHYRQDMYVILSANEGVNSPTDIKEGQSILVPYHYGSRTIAYIDKTLNLLVKLEIFDWGNNLYEFYEFKDIRLNVGLTDTDFDPDNPAYKF